MSGHFSVRCFSHPGQFYVLSFAGPDNSPLMCLHTRTPQKKIYHCIKLHVYMNAVLWVTCYLVALLSFSDARQFENTMTRKNMLKHRAKTCFWLQWSQILSFCCIFWCIPFSIFKSWEDVLSLPNAFLYFGFLIISRCGSNPNGSIYKQYDFSFSKLITSVFHVQNYFLNWLEVF